MAQEDTVTVTLTQSEAAALKAMLAQQESGEGTPVHPTGKEITVMNESLGMNPMNGEKVQWLPGVDPETGERKPFSPAPQGADRFFARERRRQEALVAAKARGQKNKKSVHIQVGDMADKLKGRNVTDTEAYIDTLAPHDREIAVLAEEMLHEGGRKAIIQHPGYKVSRKVREAYQAELAIISDMEKE